MAEMSVPAWPRPIQKTNGGGCGSCLAVVAGEFFEVGDGGTRPELPQDVVAAGRPGQLRHAARWVLQVAERDGLGGARLLARGLDLPLPHRPLLVPRRVLPGHDPLDTHGALLHYAELADRDVRVELERERVGEGVAARRGGAVVPPVEAPHLVGAV